MQANQTTGVHANKDDMCNICFTSELGSDPCVKLECGHVFHAECVKDLIKHRWSSLRITFDFMSCPACKFPIRQLNHVPQIQTEINKVLKLKEQVNKLANKVKSKGKIDMKPTKQENGEWYQREDEFVMAKSAFYQCWECMKPFFGGLVDCERDLNLAETTSKKDLKCKQCQVKSFGGGQFFCKLHGSKFITWKCYLCCTEALYKCGDRYYCEAHHDWEEHEPEECDGVNCPLGVPHPPNSKNHLKSMYPLGCSICR